MKALALLVFCEKNPLLTDECPYKGPIVRETYPSQTFGMQHATVRPRVAMNILLYFYSGNLFDLIVLTFLTGSSLV